jgi:hypothetical protein
MSTSFSIHHVHSVEVQEPKSLDMTGGTPFVHRTIVITDERGQRHDITLFCNGRDAAPLQIKEARQ